VVVKAICIVSLILGLLTGSMGGFIICWLGGFSIAQAVAIHQACAPFRVKENGEGDKMGLFALALEEGLFK
jgi:sugar/nucleoside kinase (ribokinase family)